MVDTSPRSGVMGGLLCDVLFNALSHTSAAAPNKRMGTMSQSLSRESECADTVKFLERLKATAHRTISPVTDTRCYSRRARV